MSFDNLRIRTKLNALVLLVMVCMAVAGFAIAVGVKHELLNSRIDELRAMTESAKGLAAVCKIKSPPAALRATRRNRAFARQLATMTYDHGQGYVFAYRMDGTVVSLPDLKTIGTNRLDALFNGRAVIREIRDAVQTSGEAVLYYDFPRAGETTAIPKVSYATAFPAWNMFLGTGAYIDDVNAKFLSAAIAIGGGVSVWRSSSAPPPGSYRGASPTQSPDCRAACGVWRPASSTSTSREGTPRRSRRNGSGGGRLQAERRRATAAGGGSRRPPRRR